MYFWAFNSISAIVYKGLFARATTNSLDFSSVLKVVNCTLSSTWSTSRTSLVKRFIYNLRWADGEQKVVNCTFSPCLMVSKWSVGLFGCCPPMKWLIKEFPSCSKLSMDDVACLLNHTHAASLKVVGKEWHNIPSKGCYRLKVILKVVIWSNRSLKPSNDSCCRRRNFGGIWHSRTFMVKGESVLLTIPSKWTRTSLDHFSPHFSKEVWICFVRSVWLSVFVSSVAIFIIILVSPNPHGWAILLML